MQKYRVVNIFREAGEGAALYVLRFILTLGSQGRLDCVAAGAWNGDPDGTAIQPLPVVNAADGLIVRAPTIGVPSGGSSCRAGRSSSNGDGRYGSSSVVGAGGFLPGQVTLNSLTKAQRAAALGQASSLKTSSTAVAVASVACVECLSPPYGSGPPFETTGGMWLLQLEEGGPAAAAAGGGESALASRGVRPGIAGAATTVIPMYLHSELRLLVMGRMPLLAGGRRVRIAAVPPRSSRAGARPLVERLLPTRYMVPELSASLLAPGCWPHFDALRNGGTDPMSLQQASEGAMEAVLPGSRAKVGGWVLARVVSIGAAPLREPGAFDRHRKRIIYLADPTGSSEATDAASVPGAASITATLGLYGDAVQLGDLMLPGEVVAIYEPTVFVHEAGTAAYGERQALSYEHSPDTILAVIPSVRIQVPNACQPMPSVGTTHIELDGELSSAAATANLRPAGADMPAPEIPGPQQHSDRSSDSHSLSASQAPTHAFQGLGSFGQGLHMGRSQMGGCGALAAAGMASGYNKEAGVGRTVVVARVHAVLGYVHGAGTTHGGCLRVLFNDGTGSAAVEMHLARGSKVLSHMREGHVVILMGAIQLPASSAAHKLLVSSAVEALRVQEHLPSVNGGGGVAASGVLDHAIHVHTLAWFETEMGSEAYSLTAMPAHMTTPPLVMYTSLAALKLAHLQVIQQRLWQYRQLHQHPERGQDCLIPQQSHWPTDILRALAAAACQLSDPRGAWGQDVPYLQRPFRLVAPVGDGDTLEIRQCRHGDDAVDVRSGPGGSAAGAMALTFSRSPLLTGTDSLEASLCGQGGVDGVARELTTAAVSAGPGRSNLVACAPDGWCSALACVVEVRSAHVETHRVHRQCGRLVRRAASMFMDFDFDDMDNDNGAGVVGGSAMAGGGGGVCGAATRGAALAQGPASIPAQDTPSKDQSMDGLWECAFCGLDLVKDDITWQYHGSLTLEDAAQAAGIRADMHAATHAVTLPADPEALHSLLGVSAAAFHSLGTARRRRVVQDCLVDRRGLIRRCVVALYPKPRRQQGQQCDPVVALSFNDTASGDSRRPMSSDGQDTCCQLADYWAVAQLHPVD
ncbi:hypothetical protein VaNZ11_006635 [Volvox africanus]|uniref:CST complex subunit CTC1 n=1 Tax=Volvox africanus TaxID=51714 RepID=A0ABQ5S1K1_9CHLO|nr:hypothetical protein VaNZ11_006635 [Volvox africanus]